MVNSLLPTLEAEFQKRRDIARRQITDLTVNDERVFLPRDEKQLLAKFDEYCGAVEGARKMSQQENASNAAIWMDILFADSKAQMPRSLNELILTGQDIIGIHSRKSSIRAAIAATGIAAAVIGIFTLKPSQSAPAPTATADTTNTPAQVEIVSAKTEDEQTVEIDTKKFSAGKTPKSGAEWAVPSATSKSPER